MKWRLDLVKTPLRKATMSRSNENSNEDIFHPERRADVFMYFLLKMGDIPAKAMLLCQRVNVVCDKKHYHFDISGFWRTRLQADPNVPGLYFSTIRIATNVEELET